MDFGIVRKGKRFEGKKRIPKNKGKASLRRRRVKGERRREMDRIGSEEQDEKKSQSRGDRIKGESRYEMDRIGWKNRTRSRNQEETGSGENGDRKWTGSDGRVG